MNGILRAGVAVALTANAASMIIIPIGPSINMMPMYPSIGSLESISHVLKVPCIDCDFGKDVDGPQSLIFNISVGAGKKSLELNSVPFYPPSLSNIFLNRFSTVFHVNSDVTIQDVTEHPSLLIKNDPVPVTSWVVSALSSKPPFARTISLMDIEIRITSLDEKYVRVPRVEVMAIKDSFGRFALLKATYAKDDKPRACYSLPFICKLRDNALNRSGQVAGVVSGAVDKVCGGVEAIFRPKPFWNVGGNRPNRLPDASAKNSDSDTFISKTDLERLRNTESLRKERNAHSFDYYVRNLLMYVLAPFLFGMASAAFVYVLVMALGYLVAAVWRFSRSDRAIQLRESRHNEEEQPLYSYEDQKDLPDHELNVNKV